MSFLKTNDIWRSGQYYRSQERYKSLVAYLNKLYICTQSHTSGGTFDHNKFTPVADSSGGLSGTWDMTPTGTPASAGEYVGIAYNTTPNRISKIGGNQFGALVIDNVASDNVPIIFENVPSGTNINYVFFGFVNTEASATNVLAALLGGPPPEVTSLLISAISIDNTFYAYNYTTSQSSQIDDNQLHYLNQPVLFKIVNENGYNKMYVKVQEDSSYHFTFQDLASHAPNGMKGVFVIIYSDTQSSAPDVVITSFGSNIVEAPYPDGVADGKRYLISGGGPKNGVVTKAGDIVEIYGEGQIFVNENGMNVQSDISSVVSSLQSQISAIPIPNGIKTVRTIIAQTQSQYNFITASEVITEMVHLNFTSIPTNNSLMELNISRDINDTADFLILVQFPTDTIDSNLYNFKISAMTTSNNNYQDQKNYIFNVYNIQKMLFRYTNGIIEYIGIKPHNELVFIEDIPSDIYNTVKTYNFDGNISSSQTVHPLDYSDTNEIIFEIPAGNAHDIYFDLSNPLYSNSLSQVKYGGIKLKININAGATAQNITVVDGSSAYYTIFSTQTPVEATNKYYTFIYFPKKAVLIADFNNPA